jgi:hypothetical protein
VTVAGIQTTGELQDLLNNWVPRMQELGDAFAKFGPQWEAQDPAAFVDFSSDWAALNDRWTPALAAAQSVIASAILPASMSPAQVEYNGIMKALRQNYPPDGAAIKKGDWDDLYQRLTTAQGTPPAITTVQPTAVDLDLQALQETAPLDVIAKLTGQEAPTPSSPTSSLGWALVGILAGVAGAFGGSLAGPPGAIAGAMVGGVAGYSLKGKLASVLPSWL